MGDNSNTSLLNFNFKTIWVDSACRQRGNSKGCRLWGFFTTNVIQDGVPEKGHLYTLVVGCEFPSIIYVIY